MKSKVCFWGWTLLASIPTFCASRTAPIILLDPGHTPQQQGALGARGQYEVVYNDRFVAQLAVQLREAGFMVTITREPDQHLSLDERVALANRQKPALFLSIHHDSTQLQYLEKVDMGGIPAYRTIQPIAGFSVFVSKRNSRFSDSYRFAEQLGQALTSVGRLPNLHHAEQIAGENRLLLNAKWGVYQFDDLRVLAKTRVPAVLLEVGVIVDAKDEHMISDPVRQHAIFQAIVQAIRAFCR